MSKTKTKRQLWAELTTKATQLCEQNSTLGMTIEQARDQLMTPQFMSEYRAAPDDDDDAAVVFQQSGDRWQGRAAEKSVYDQVTEKAAKLRERKPSLTKEQAFVEVLDENPDLYQAYRDAEAEDAQAGEQSATGQPTRIAQTPVNDNVRVLVKYQNGMEYRVSPRAARQLRDRGVSFPEGFSPAT